MQSDSVYKDLLDATSTTGPSGDESHRSEQSEESEGESLPAFTLTAETQVMTQYDQEESQDQTLPYDSSTSAFMRLSTEMKEQEEGRKRKRSSPIRSTGHATSDAAIFISDDPITATSTPANVPTSGTSQPKKQRKASPSPPGEKEPITGKKRKSSLSKSSSGSITRSSPPPTDKPAGTQAQIYGPKRLAAEKKLKEKEQKKQASAAAKKKRRKKRRKKRQMKLLEEEEEEEEAEEDYVEEEAVTAGKFIFPAMILCINMYNKKKLRFEFSHDVMGNKK